MASCVLMRMLVRVLSLAFDLLRLLLAVLLELLRFVLANLRVVACSILSLTDIIGTFLFALFVLGAEDVGDGLEEVGCDFELGGHQSHDTGGEASAAVVMLCGFGVFVCDERHGSWNESL